MENFLIFDPKGINPQGKSRVYFTCHPSDYYKYFDKICDDIFKKQDCVIYHTEKMAEEIPIDCVENDLNQMVLFVVPITFLLLTTNNRAINFDIPFAFKHHIPVLPLMMEAGLDELYSKKFGNREYISPFNNDDTAISYDNKLENYLNDTLVNNETSKRIKNEFDDYFFLSYRKKDRQYANELIQSIHKYPDYRDVAIWYDEHLTPGEIFTDEIKEMIDKSNLFVLLVTPNLLEKGNYVMDEEYPEAKRKCKTVLPVEMSKTGRISLKTNYKKIPKIINNKNIQKGLSKVYLKLPSKRKNPIHKYLIGLAYLNGIDTEINRGLALNLISDAAESGSIEAMVMFEKIYREGIGTDIDLYEANKWAEKIADYYIKRNGENDKIALKAQSKFATSLRKSGEPENIKKAAEIDEKVYKIYQRTYGDDEFTAVYLSNWALDFSQRNLPSDGVEAINKQKKALQICENLCKKHMMEEDYPFFISTINNLACSYDNHGSEAQKREALKLHERAYDLSLSRFGPNDQNTLRYLSTKAHSYDMNGVGWQKREAIKLNEQAYKHCCSILGNKHPFTLDALDNYAYSLMHQNDFAGAIEKYEAEYQGFVDIIKEQPCTGAIRALKNSACCYIKRGKPGDFETAISIYEKVFILCKKTLGEEKQETQNVLFIIASLYLRKCKNHNKELTKRAIEWCDKITSSEMYISSNVANTISEIYKMKNKN